LTTANYFALGSFYPYISLCGKYVNFLAKQRVALIWLGLNMQGIYIQKFTYLKDLISILSTVIGVLILKFTGDI